MKGMTMFGTFGRRWAAVLLTVGTILPSAGASADDRKQLIFETIDRNAAQMTLLSDSLFYFGELGMQEVESTKLLKETLEAAGFKVELGGAGMPTNVWATYGSGRPKIAIVTEVDALPGGSQTAGTYERKPLVSGGPGHMEGHNTHGGVASAAAFAVKQAMQRFNIPGTVAISFGPAEEQLISRPFLVRAGYFKDVDAVLYLHIQDSSQTGYGLQNYAAISSVVHLPRQDRPWRQQSVGRQGRGRRRAADGHRLRQAARASAPDLPGAPDHHHRRHPAQHHRRHRADLVVRARRSRCPKRRRPTRSLLKIAEGAALMTGTTYDVKYSASAWPQLGNKTIAEAIQKNIDTVGVPQMDRRGAEVRARLPEVRREAAGRPQHQAGAAGWTEAVVPRRTTTATCPGWCRPAS